MSELDDALRRMHASISSAPEPLRRYYQSRAWFSDIENCIYSARDEQGEEFKAIWTEYAVQIVGLVLFDIVTTGYMAFLERNLPSNWEANYQMTPAGKRLLMDGILKMIKRGRAVR